MRVEINLPENKDFIKKLQVLIEADKRSRKNLLETIIINFVNGQSQCLPQFGNLKLVKPK